MFLLSVLREYNEVKTGLMCSQGTVSSRRGASVVEPSTRFDVIHIRLDWLRMCS